MSRTYHSFHSLKERPPQEQRLFTSKAVEDLIQEVSKDVFDPEIRKMFERCFPNTLDTTVYFEEKDNQFDTYIVTGDIPAMWLRDSTYQVWPYISLVAQDETLQNLFRGLIRRQAHSILIDPYANAFNDQHISHQSRGKWWESKSSWHDGVWERKWELDSLAAFLRLSRGYWEKTQDIQPFDSEWLQAYDAIIKVIRVEMKTFTRHSASSIYRFYDRKGVAHPAIRMNGYGYPGKSCGLIRTVFRPSDDEAVFPYHIPANAMIEHELRKIIGLLNTLNMHHMSFEATDLANTIAEGISTVGIVKHQMYGKIYAYEVDGFGSHCIMDDPNIPSLLSLPYLGYCSNSEEVYRNTRKLILSSANPYYAKGQIAEGLTSPHTGVLTHFWPLGTIMQALTSDSEEEILQCLRTLKSTHAGTYFMHESINVDTPTDYTRSWFSWANSLFGELILHIHQRYPQILNELL
jgi:meiotically up-regulated gene 157 (Mug157) protein